MKQLKQNNKKCTGSHCLSGSVCTCDTNLIVSPNGKSESKLEGCGASFSLSQALMPECLQQGPQAHNENYSIPDQTHASFVSFEKNHLKS